MKPQAGPFAATHASRIARPERFSVTAPYPERDTLLTANSQNLSVGTGSRTLRMLRFVAEPSKFARTSKEPRSSGRSCRKLELGGMQLVLNDEGAVLDPPQTLPGAERGEQATARCR